MFITRIHFLWADTGSREDPHPNKMDPKQCFLENYLCFSIELNKI